MIKKTRAKPKAKPARAKAHAKTHAKTHAGAASTAAPVAAPAPADKETEQKILDAARQVFIKKGTEGARMAEIADVAGVNQALLHYYFRSKERLSFAVFSQIMGQMFRALQTALGSDLPLDEKIDRVISVYIENLSRSPFMPGYLISELTHHPERVPMLLEAAFGTAPNGVLPRILDKLKSQIDHAVAAGTMRPITAEQFAVNLVSLCIFPFAARPMLSLVFGMNDAAFLRFIGQRKTELPAFFKNALRP